MSSRRPLIFLLLTGLLLGVMAQFWIGFPPNPVNPWIAAAWTIGPAERWWYSLPEATRTQGLYSGLVSMAGLVYPTFVTVMFVTWGWPLRNGRGFYPRRSLWLAATILGGSAVYYTFGWHWGLEYQGLSTLLTYLGVTLAYLLGLTLLWLRGRERDSWIISLIWHLGLFVWFCGLAFPWLGEVCC